MVTDPRPGLPARERPTGHARRRAVRLARALGLYGGTAALGFVVGVVALYVSWIRRGPELRIWHTAVLSAEYTRDSPEQDLEGYRDREGRLFTQLDEEIYSHTTTGVAKVLARYSAGSAADPRGRMPDWNRTVELPAARPVGGVLLLHGLSDSPYSLRALGETLNERGFHVVAVRLPGHGTAPSGLLNTTWEDMAAAARLGLKHLTSRVDGPVHVVGYSTGAALAVSLSLDALEDPSEPEPETLVLISPAIGVTPAAALAQWTVRLSHLPGLEKAAWTDNLPEFDPYKYNSFASNAGQQVHRLTRQLKGRVERRGAAGPIRGFPPTLVFLSAVDATVSAPAVIDNLLEHLEPHRHELVLFDINRFAASSTVLVSDPGPLAARLMADDEQPFGLALISNESPETEVVVARRKPSLSTRPVVEPLDAAWPPGVLSLSHVALPFPPDDPVYGRRPPEDRQGIFLGHIPVQGERGLLLFSSDWLLRLRHNPFYDVLEAWTIAWLEGAPGPDGEEPSPRR